MSSDGTEAEPTRSNLSSAEERLESVLCTRTTFLAASFETSAQNYTSRLPDRLPRFERAPWLPVTPWLCLCGLGLVMHRAGLCEAMRGAALARPMSTACPHCGGSRTTRGLSMRSALTMYHVRRQRPARPDSVPNTEKHSSVSGTRSHSQRAC